MKVDVKDDPARQHHQDVERVTLSIVYRWWLATPTNGNTCSGSSLR